jgi:hypothetical protein
MVLDWNSLGSCPVASYYTPSVEFHVAVFTRYNNHRTVSVTARVWCWTVGILKALYEFTQSTTTACISAVPLLIRSQQNKVLDISIISVCFFPFYLMISGNTISVVWDVDATNNAASGIGAWQLEVTQRPKGEMRRDLSLTDHSPMSAHLSSAFVNNFCPLLVWTSSLISRTLSVRTEQDGNISNLYGLHSWGVGLESRPV